MIRFVFAVIFLVIALVIFLLARPIARENRTSVAAPIAAGAAVLVVAVLFGLWSGVKSVPAASVGIPTTFGKVGSDLQPGVHFLAPWTSVHAESTRNQQYVFSHIAGESTNGANNDSITVNTADSVAVDVDVAVNYHVDAKSADKLFTTIGSIDNLNAKYIRQDVRSAVPAVFATYTATAAASTDRDTIANQIFSRLEPNFESHGVTLSAVQIRTIQLPTVITDAAEQKIKQEQATQQAQFAQQQAQIDAKTAAIKAQGTADANAILSKSLTPEILCSKYLDVISQVTVPQFSTACGATTAGSSASSNPTPTIILDGRK